MNDFKNSKFVEIFSKYRLSEIKVQLWVKISRWSRDFRKKFWSLTLITGSYRIRIRGETSRPPSKVKTGGDPLIEQNCALTVDRTQDLQIFSLTLSQLSYQGNWVLVLNNTSEPFANPSAIKKIKLSIFYYNKRFFFLILFLDFFINLFFIWFRFL